MRVSAFTFTNALRNGNIRLMDAIIHRVDRSRSWLTFRCGPQKQESSFKRPPSPGGIRDASPRAQTCPWRIDKLMRRSESGTTLDSASATYMNRNLWVMRNLQHAAPAGVHPIRHALDGRYSNVGKRLTSSPDPPLSRTAFDRGTRAELCRSGAL